MPGLVARGRTSEHGRFQAELGGRIARDGARSFAHFCCGYCGAKVNLMLENNPAMKLLLDAIQFNHDPTSAARDALTIRRDATREVILPEWWRGVCMGPEDTPAAYAMAETQGQTVTIKARARAVFPGIDMVEVRGLDPTVRDRGWIAGFLTRLGILHSPFGKRAG